MSVLKNKQCIMILGLVFFNPLWSADIPQVDIQAQEFNMDQCINDNTQNCINDQCLTSESTDCQAQCQQNATSVCQQQSDD